MSVFSMCTMHSMQDLQYSLCLTTSHSGSKIFSSMRHKQLDQTIDTMTFACVHSKDILILHIRRGLSNKYPYLTISKHFIFKNDIKTVKGLARDIFKKG